MPGSNNFNPRSELDIAQLKFEMRQMYRQVGFWGCLAIFTDMIVGARVLGEVMVEESQKEPK